MKGATGAPAESTTLTSMMLNGRPDVHMVASWKSNGARRTSGDSIDIEILPQHSVMPPSRVKCVKALRRSESKPLPWVHMVCSRRVYHHLSSYAVMGTVLVVHLSFRLGFLMYIEKYLYRVSPLFNCLARMTTVIYCNTLDVQA
jgi:hypothetical protein